MQRISISETNCAIQWIEIYPTDRGIHHFNNWGQGLIFSKLLQVQFIRVAIVFRLQNIFSYDVQGDLFVKDNILLRSVRASLHEGGGPTVGEVTCLGGVTTSGNPPSRGQTF